MTTSGIDRALSFRRLVIVRTTPLPGGGVTESLLKKFKVAGGIFVGLSTSDVRTLYALQKMEELSDAEYAEWLRLRRPASGLPVMQTLVPLSNEGTENEVLDTTWRAQGPLTAPPAIPPVEPLNESKPVRTAVQDSRHTEPKPYYCLEGGSFWSKEVRDSGRHRASGTKTE